VISKGNYHNLQDKFFATQKSNKMRVNDVAAAAAKVNAHTLCNCPESEPGKVSADIRAHQPGCHIRGKLKTGRYTVNTSVTPQKFNDGCNLGVVLGD
jgi:hypothetical protein